MFKQICTIAAMGAAVFLGSMNEANANNGLMTPVNGSANYQPADCRWDPQGSAVCRGRNFCYQSPYHPKCQLYCSNFPYDRICNDRGPRGPRGPRWPRF